MSLTLIDVPPERMQVPFDSAMTYPVTRQNLRPTEMSFIAAMHELDFGRFESLQIRTGELILDPWPITIRDIKFATAKNSGNRELGADELRPQVAELFEYVRRGGAGEIRTLEVRHGLPFSMEVELAGARRAFHQESAVAEVTLDQVLPIVQDLAKRKANAFVHRYNIAIDENEDIASQLVMTFVARWPKYDNERASIPTFVSRLMDKELMSILRYRLAQCRQVRELPVPYTGPAPESIHQFRIDIDRVMATMPDVFRETASALSWSSGVDAAAELGVSRQTVSVRKNQIKAALLAADITPSYFSR